MKEDLLDGNSVHVVLDDERLGSAEVVEQDFAGRGADPEVEAVAERQRGDLRQGGHLWAANNNKNQNIKNP